MYESPEAASAKREYRDVLEKWEASEVPTKTLVAALRKWDRLRTKDAEIEASVREALEADLALAPRDAK